MSSGFDINKNLKSCKSYIVRAKFKKRSTLEMSNMTEEQQAELEDDASCLVNNDKMQREQWRDDYMWLNFYLCDLLVNQVPS